MDLKNLFIKAIHDKKLVSINFESKEKGSIQRKCVPFDFGPSRRNMEINHDRFHLYDLDSPDESHNLSILPSQSMNLQVLDEDFDPKNYVTWNPPYNWFVSRDWGIYS